MATCCANTPHVCLLQMLIFTAIGNRAPAVWHQCRCHGNREIPRGFACHLGNGTPKVNANCRRYEFLYQFSVISIISSGMWVACFSSPGDGLVMIDSESRGKIKVNYINLVLNGLDGTKIIVCVRITTK